MHILEMSNNIFVLFMGIMKIANRFTVVFLEFQTKIKQKITM